MHISKHIAFPRWAIAEHGRVSATCRDSERDKVFGGLLKSYKPASLSNLVRKQTKLCPTDLPKRVLTAAEVEAEVAASLTEVLADGRRLLQLAISALGSGLRCSLGVDLLGVDGHQLPCRDFPYDDEGGSTMKMTADDIVTDLRRVEGCAASIMPGFGGAPPSTAEFEAAIRTCGALTCYIDPASHGVVRAATAARLASLAGSRFEITPVSAASVEGNTVLLIHTANSFASWEACDG